MKYFSKTPIIILIMLLFSSNSKAQERGHLIKPNVIIFYADDLGWQDTQLNNLDKPSPWKTPNITKLAHDGLNFTNAYSPAPTCAPSRASMLSGLHPTKINVTHVRGGTIPKARYSNHMAPFLNEGLLPKYFTMAEALKMNGYTTGHVGKWHLGKLKRQAPDKQGFDFTFSGRGAHQGPKKSDTRLSKFATHKPRDPYRLSDEKYPPFSEKFPKGISYPKDDVTENAIQFINDSKDKPFFLYLAHWMVHSPIHTKNRNLLQYYSDQLNIDFPAKDLPITTQGQTNPYYGSMVTTLDWSLGRIVDLLQKTDDPRNPGKKLYETTYLLFSSDNGGAERVAKEIVTDNLPLDQGKKYAQEGGIRVPLVIYGPHIPKGAQYHGLVNQLDFFPTILNLTNSNISAKNQSNLDGLNIADVLLNNEKEIKNKKGKVREDLWWHFPHNQDFQMQSAIRFGDFKLYKNHVQGDYELYRLYNNGKRADLEEKFNIAATNKKITKKLSAKLDHYLKTYDAKFPYRSLTKDVDPAEKDNIAAIPVALTDTFDAKTNKATIQLEKGKSKVIEAYALISIGDKSNTAKATSKGRKGKSMYVRVPVVANMMNTVFSFDVPKEALNYLFVLIDAHRYMVKGKIHKVNGVNF